MTVAHVEYRASAKFQKYSADFFLNLMLLYDLLSWTYLSQLKWFKIWSFHSAPRLHTLARECQQMAYLSNELCVSEESASRVWGGKCDCLLC